MVRANGRRLRGSILEIRTVRSTTTPPRVGLIVPRHSHTAVDRNRVKRRLREIIRTDRLMFRALGTAVVFALPGAYHAAFEELRTELDMLCRRATE